MMPRQTRWTAWRRNDSHVAVAEDGHTPPQSTWTTWLRNGLFLALVLAGAFLLVDRLWSPHPVPQARAFRPIKDSMPDFEKVVGQIDAAFQQHWDEKGVKPAPPAPSLLVARRLSLALAGTIPSLQEIRAFEAQPEAERTQWWLSHLFEDRRCSDYVAERFARAFVGVEKGPFLQYRRRRLVDWLSDAFQRNQPYDQVVRSLIDSKGIWTTTPEVNFVTVTIDQNDKKKGPDEVKLAARVTRAFLGLRIDCVECHNDKFGDRWKQKDFHQLAAFFAPAEMSLTGLRDNPRSDYQFRYLGAKQEAKVPPVVPWEPGLLPKDGTLRERLAAWVTDPRNRPFARATVNRVWACLFDRPLVQPVDNIPLEGPYPPGLEILTDDLIAHHYDLQRLIRLIAATRVFQLDSRSPDPNHPVTEESDRHWAAFPLTRLRPEQMAGSVIQASSLSTINAETHVLFRIAKAINLGDFVKRYGDSGEDEFSNQSGTIPQRLLLMNGEIVHKRIEKNPLMNASTRIGSLAPDDARAVETAYLAVFSRRPTAEEAQHFTGRLHGTQGDPRAGVMADLHWTLLNSTEFSWNH